MRKYTSKDKFTVRGKTVFEVENDERFERDKGHLLGETVEINGAQYKVIGVDSYALQWIREGAPIGLMVEETTATPREGEKS